MSQNRRIQVANSRQQGTTGTTLNERFGTLHEETGGINKFGGGRGGGRVGQTATFQLNRNFGGGRGGGNANVAVSFVGRGRGGGNALRNGGGRGAFRNGSLGGGRGRGRGRGRGGKPKRMLSADEQLEKLDKEMDNYMNKDEHVGKARLDDDIDEYMKAAGKNEESKNEGTSTAAIKT